MRSLKIGVAGTGFMGLNHLRHLQKMPDVQVVGIHDISEKSGESVSEAFQIPFYPSYKKLLEDVEAVVITVPTTAHFNVTQQAIIAKKHVFVEKPFMQSTQEARAIQSLLKTYPVKVQVGHVERFNPVFQQLLLNTHWENLVSIDFQRHIPLRKQVDVDIILAVMVHDLDLLVKVAQMQGTEITEVQAMGVTDPALQKIDRLVDYVSVQIKLKSGAIARLSGSRSGAHHERSIRLIEKNRTIEADLLNRELRILERQDHSNYKYNEQKIQVAQREPLYDEMARFVSAVIEDHHPEVDEQDGLTVLELIDDIKQKVYKK